MNPATSSPSRASLVVQGSPCACEKELVSFRRVSVVLNTAQFNLTSRCLISSASCFASWRCSGRELRSYNGEHSQKM
ncbi:hypothetical protein HETIRDRAFT_141576 [Heterobasidion irregulare TC 32-1]|uniref:Uncharacterized protein n=1 Tax=Heterobasidion irregulare (strain TC 32-1) TaxID=747525 RepID=W4K926_HETIT|nr:uncharacterized protein HETIRDRAFT_141576 [Heterobasidion irregulare TC 32-1]ETW82327.1 hypothetical protein HETIRDRAFT_141576 [Heterobasidion irregulare TC 32-1]